MSGVTLLSRGTGSALVEAVAANVRAEAARRRLTQTDLARALGMSQVAVSDRYRGRTPWTLGEVEALTRILRVGLEELLLPRLDSNQQPSGFTTAQVIDLGAERTARRGGTSLEERAAVLFLELERELRAAAALDRAGVPA